MPAGLTARNPNIRTPSPPPPCNFHNLPPELIIKILTSVSTPLESRQLLSNHLQTCAPATCYLLLVRNQHRATINRTLLTALPGATQLFDLYRLLYTADPTPQHLSTPIDFSVAARALEQLTQFAGLNAQRVLGRRIPSASELIRIHTGVYIVAYLTLLGMLLQHAADHDFAADAAGGAPALESYGLDEILDRAEPGCLGPIAFPRGVRGFLRAEIVEAGTLAHVGARELLYAHHVAAALLAEKREPAEELRLFTLWCGDLFWRTRGGDLINRVNFWLVGERNRVVEVLAKELCRRGGGGRRWWAEDVKVGWPLVPRPGEEEREWGAEWARWVKWDRSKGGWGLWDEDVEDVEKRLGEEGRGWEITWW